jgi:hypothetical protein
MQSYLREIIFTLNLLVLKADFRKCHRRPQNRLPLGCKPRGYHVARLSCKTAFQDERTYQLIVQNCPPHIDTETLLDVAWVRSSFEIRRALCLVDG